MEKDVIASLQTKLALLPALTLRFLRFLECHIHCEIHGPLYAFAFHEFCDRAQLEFGILRAVKQAGVKAHADSFRAHWLRGFFDADKNANGRA